HRLPGEREAVIDGDDGLRRLDVGSGRELIAINLEVFELYLHALTRAGHYARVNIAFFPDDQVCLAFALRRLSLALPSPHEFVLLGEDGDGEQLNEYDNRANDATGIDRSAHRLFPPKCGLLVRQT